MKAHDLALPRGTGHLPRTTTERARRLTDGSVRNHHVRTPAALAFCAVIAALDRLLARDQAMRFRARPGPVMPWAAAGYDHPGADTAKDLRRG